MLKKLSVLLWGMFLASACLLATGSAARADETIYGNNAGTGIVYGIDLNTGVVTNQYDVTSGNGRGVVVVGDIMYTTDANSNSVYAYNLATSTNLGVAFSVTGASGLSTMAYDGTNFWIGDYSGTNNVYEYTPTGTLLATVSLSQCSSYCDGLEYLAANGGELISNEFDGGYRGVNTYDVYSLTGTLLQADFLNSSAACGTSGGTGIAFDGTDYFISCIFQNQLGEYDANGNFIKDIPYTGATGYIEDLSANYQQVLNIPTPEPSSLASLALGLIALGALTMWRKRLGVAAE